MKASYGTMEYFRACRLLQAKRAYNKAKIGSSIAPITNSELSLHILKNNDTTGIIEAMLDGQVYYGYEVVNGSYTRI